MNVFIIYNQTINIVVGVVDNQLLAEEIINALQLKYPLDEFESYVEQVLFSKDEFNSYYGEKIL